MRRFIAAVLIVLALQGVQAQTGPDVRLAELLPEPAGGREFVELWNAGDAPQDLTGWFIEDAAGNRFTFGAHTLAPGARIVVWGGGDPNAAGPAWSKAAVWNNGGDTAFLHGPNGLADTLTYGAGGEPVPPPGESLALEDSTWRAGAPTPGQAPGTTGGYASATVQNVAPNAAIDAPASAAANEQIWVNVIVSDDNGDPVTWMMQAGPDAYAGNATGSVLLTMPAEGTLDLQLQATDGELTRTVNHTIAIAAPLLVVTLPTQGIDFPGLVPGATNVMASAPFTIQNQGNASATPRIDVSDFTGPAVIPVQGNLSLGIGNASWIAYDGPLTVLPPLPPGASVDVWLRLDTTPKPLPAGQYGTSFTVIP